MCVCGVDVPEVYDDGLLWGADAGEMKKVCECGYCYNVCRNVCYM